MWSYEKTYLEGTSIILLEYFAGRVRSIRLSVHSTTTINYWICSRPLHLLSSFSFFPHSLWQVSPVGHDGFSECYSQLQQLSSKKGTGIEPVCVDVIPTVYHRPDYSQDYSGSVVEVWSNKLGLLSIVNEYRV